MLEDKSCICLVDIEKAFDRAKGSDGIEIEEERNKRFG